MGAGDVATVLKTFKVFVDFIPDPVKTPVSALLDISISICERVGQVSENVQAVADLAEQQAGISADVVNELRGVTQAQIDSGDWVRRLEKLSETLEKVREWVFKDSEDVKGDSKSAKAVAKAVKAVAKLWNSQEKKKEIDALRAELDGTRAQLKLQLGIATLVGVQRITEIARGLMRVHHKALVSRLKPVFSARYGAHGSPGDCLPNTRLALRDDLRQLLTADDGQRIVWLSGLAGTGKSTVARSICSDFKDTHDVVSFFIKRGIVERSDQRRTLHTLVYQLAQCIPQVFSTVVHAEDDLFDAHIHNQVNDLVATPLSTVLPGARPVVIVLDAADERGNTTPNECDLIPCFLDAIASAAFPVRVLITSRGHPSDFLRPTYDSEAVHATQGLLQSVVKEVSMHDKSYHPDSDIKAYLVEQFKRVAMKRHLSNWPSPDQIRALVRMSAQLFIFAATIIRWVDCSAAEFALGQLLRQSSVLMERTGPDTIFTLYEYVIGHALDENTPLQLLRSALGKSPDDGTGVDALCREATLSILSTLRCLRKLERTQPLRKPMVEWPLPLFDLRDLYPVVEPEPDAGGLTRSAFAQLWAGHLVAEPELYQGVVAIVGDLIARLSGVLFVWEHDSSMTLLHASFGDFLDATSSRYHISSETTHFDLASKCISIMLSTKDAYSQSCSASSVDLLLNHRLNVIPWILNSDLAAQYSFAQWIFHACSAPHIQRARLLEQVHIAERGFWSAGVFLHPTYTNIESLQQAFDTMRDAEAGYTIATAVYMCADEIPDFKFHNRRSLSISSFHRIASFQMMCDALSIFSHGSAGSAGSDSLTAMVEHRVDWLDQLLRDVHHILDHWMDRLRHVRELYDAPRDARGLDGHWNYQMVPLHNLTVKLILDLGFPVTSRKFDTKTVPINSINSSSWPSNFSTSIYRLAAILDDFQLHIRRWNEEMNKLASIAQELEKWAEEFRYSLREFKYQIVKPYDEQVIAALDRRNACLTNEPAHEGDAPLDSTLSAGHSLGFDAPSRPERQSLQVDEVLPAESHPPGTVDQSPSEGQSSQGVTPIAHEERVTVTTSTASTVCFFAVLVLLYVLLSSLFA